MTNNFFAYFFTIKPVNALSMSTKTIFWHGTFMGNYFNRVAWREGDGFVLSRIDGSQGLE
jgi:hypothetical protein